MSKESIVTIAVAAVIFMALQQYMIVRYAGINDRLQTSIDQCCFGKGR